MAYLPTSPLTDIRIEGLKASIIHYAVYQTWFIIFSIFVLRRCQYYMQKYGTLDEHTRGRDLVPDALHNRVSYALLAYSFTRCLGAFLLGKDWTEVPDISLLTPFKMGLFLIVLDYCTPTFTWLTIGIFMLTLLLIQFSMSTIARHTNSTPCGSSIASTMLPKLRHPPYPYGPAIGRTFWSGRWCLHLPIKSSRCLLRSYLLRQDSCYRQKLMVIPGFELIGHIPSSHVY